MNRITVLVFIAAMFIITGVSAENNTYTVKKGDTLYSISKKYNIKLDSLKTANNIQDASKLYPGMNIQIPGGYTVKKGDTLYSIARKYDTTVAELKNLNDMGEDHVLIIGQFLHVPADINSETVEVKVETTEIEVAEEQEIENTETEYHWPLNGEIKELEGKLKGIQIIGSPGDQIVAVSGGRVVWAAEYGIYKKLVLIEGTGGIMYGYGGNDLAKVRVGDYVVPGSIIGVLGQKSENPSAYFFVYKNGKPVDPGSAPRV